MGGPSTAGEIFTVHLHKKPGERLGMKLAGAYELGGVFVTDIAPGTLVTQDPTLFVGSRLLEVNGRSIIFATQDTVAKIIRSVGSEELIFTFQTQQMLEWSSIFNHSATDEAFRAVVRAHESRQAKKNHDSIAHYQFALQHDFADPMLRCQALGGLGTVYFEMRQYKNSVRYHALEVEAVSSCNGKAFFINVSHTVSFCRG